MKLTLTPVPSPTLRAGEGSPGAGGHDELRVPQVQEKGPTLPTLATAPLARAAGEGTGVRAHAALAYSTLVLAASPSKWIYLKIFRKICWPSCTSRFFPPSA